MEKSQGQKSRQRFVLISILFFHSMNTYVHINDNNAKWDWNYMAGSHNFLSYVEFLYYLQELGYDDFLTSDTSPTRWDIKGTFEANSRLTNKVWAKLYRIDRDEFKKLITQGNFLNTWKFIEANIFSL